MRTLLLVLLGCFVLVVALGVAGALMGGGEDGSPAKKPSPTEKTTPRVTGVRADVEVTGCLVDPVTKWPEVKIQITNHSSKPSDYWVSVEFVDARNERVAEGFVSASNLAPGQVSHESTNGLTEVSAAIKCRITDVDRWAS